jgi:phenylacetate-CoA ligase
MPRCAYYRAAFEAIGFHPSDLRQLSDIARLPFTTKADLRANYPFGRKPTPRAVWMVWRLMGY